MSQRDQVEVNKTSQILPQALWQCWIWWGDLLAVYIGITFFVSRTLRLGIRVFAAQSHWKFTLRWINKVLIGFIGCSIHSPALRLASIQLIPDQWGDWLLYRHLGKALFSCFVFFFPHCDYWKRIHHWGVWPFFNKPLQSLSLWFTADWCLETCFWCQNKRLWQFGCTHNTTECGCDYLWTGYGCVAASILSLKRAVAWFADGDMENDLHIDEKLN